MLVESSRRAVLEDARRCGLRPGTAWLLFWLPPELTALFGLSLLHRPLFVYLTREDSLLEWAQVVCFLTAAGLAGVAAARLHRRSRLGAVLLGGFAVLALVAAGEEISWGQRLFGWSTPEQLGAINHQDETTVHNIMPVQTTLNYVQLLAGLHGGVVSVALRSRWHSRPLLADLVLAPRFLAPAFLTLFAYRLVRLTVLTEDRFAFVKSGEMPELCFAFALAVMAMTFGRLDRQLPTQRSAPDGRGTARPPAERRRRLGGTRIHSGKGSGARGDTRTVR